MPTALVGKRVVLLIPSADYNKSLAELELRKDTLTALTINKQSSSALGLDVSFGNVNGKTIKMCLVTLLTAVLYAICADTPMAYNYDDEQHNATHSAVVKALLYALMKGGNSMNDSNGCCGIAAMVKAHASSAGWTATGAADEIMSDLAAAQAARVRLQQQPFGEMDDEKAWLAFTDCVVERVKLLSDCSDEGVKAYARAEIVGMYALMGLS